MVYNFRMIPLKHMTYFSAVCRTMNITKAAEELYISQPALSLAMKELEHEVGSPLFEKHGNRIVLTETARILLKEIRPITDRADHLNRMIEKGTLSRKYFRFGFSSIVGISAAPDLCHQFSQRHPEINLIISEGVGPDMLEQLDHGVLDAVLTGSYYDTAAPWAGKFHTMDISFSPLAYCVGKKHPLAKRKSVTAEEIASYPVIMLRESYPVARHIESAFEARGYHLNIALRTDQLFTVEQFIANGFFAGFLPRFSIRENTGIIPITCDEISADITTPVKLYWKKGSTSNTMNSFLECIRNDT